MRVTVQDAAWVPQEKLLTVSLRAVEADPQTQELHPMWNLDPDGSYVGDDAEALAEDERPGASTGCSRKRASVPCGR